MFSTTLGYFPAIWGWCGSGVVYRDGEHGIDGLAGGGVEHVGGGDHEDGFVNHGDAVFGDRELRRLARRDGSLRQHHDGGFGFLVHKGLADVFAVFAEGDLVDLGVHEGAERFVAFGDLLAGGFEVAVFSALVSAVKVEVVPGAGHQAEHGGVKAPAVEAADFAVGFAVIVHLEIGGKRGGLDDFSRFFGRGGGGRFHVGDWRPAIMATASRSSRAAARSPAGAAASDLLLIGGGTRAGELMALLAAVSSRRRHP